MSASSFDGLQVDTDLQLDVDGVSARLVGDGHQLTLSTHDAGTLLARTLRTLPPQVAQSDYLLPDGLPTARGVLRGGLAQVATALDALGLSARLVDDRGTVLELGRGCHSTVARVLFGADRVQLGPVFLRVAATVVRDSDVVRRRVGVAAGGGVLAALVVAAGLRRRSGSGGAR